MDKQLTDELLSRLDTLASKLGVAVEHLWSVLVRQSVLEGWLGFGLDALLLAIA